MFRIIILILLPFSIYAQPPRLVLPIGHTENITSACFSPDSKYIVTGSSDKTIKLWEAQTGMLLNEYNGHKTDINKLAFSDDGNMIISTDYYQETKWWSVSDPGNMGDTTYEWPKDQQLKLPYAPKSFLSPSRTKTVIIRNDSLIVYGADNKLIAAIKRNYWVIEPFFSPDENFIFCSTATTEREKYNHVIYDLQAGKAIPVYMEGYSFMFSPDSKKILGCGNAEATVWNAQTGEKISELKGSTSKPDYGPIFNADDKKIITVDRSSLIRTWVKENAVLEPPLHGRATLGLSMYDGKRNLSRVSDDSSSIEIVEFETGRVIKRLQIGKRNNEFSEVDMSNEKKRNQYVSGLPIFTAIPNPQYTRLVVSTGPPGAGMWNMETGKFLKGYLMNDYAASNYWSPDGKRWLITAKVQPPLLCDGLTGVVLDTLLSAGKTLDDYRRKLKKEHDDIMKILGEDNTRQKLDQLLANMNEPDLDNKISREDSILLALNNRLRQIENPDQSWLEANYVTAASFSPDGSMIVTAALDGSITAWSAVSAKELYYYNNPDKADPGTEQNSWVNSLVFSPDGKKFATASWDKSVKLWDAATGKLIANMKGHHAVVNTVQFTPDGKELLSVADTGAIRIWSASQGEYLGELRKPFNSLGDIQFSSDSKQVISTSSDNAMNVWDLPSRKLLYSFFQVDSNDYMYLLPSGYYKTSGSATKKLHYVTKDLDVMTFEQLDVKYNRPDKVLEATGCRDRSLIESYRNAYFKRLEKLGIDSSTFGEGYSMPVAEFRNRNSINAMQNNDQLSLHVAASDSIFKLDRFNIWINDVPIFGMRGISLRNQKRNDFDTTVAIVLSAGDNRIETSVTNMNGIESYRKPLQVKYSPQNELQDKVYFIGVGINEFADSSHNLKWCVQDIRDLAKTLRAKYGDRLVIIDTLFNQYATRTAIRALKRKLYNTTVNDKVIFSYSGHGLLSKDYDYYISSYTINFDNPEEGGIPYDEIEDMLDLIPARKKILLLDACNSGELDKEEMKKIQLAGKDLEQNHVAVNNISRGVIVTSTDSAARVSYQNSFELMQSLFVNVGKRTGAVIISASGGVQFAQERSELGHGVFTYSVIEALKKFPGIRVSEFRKYIGDRVMELTNGLQKPNTRSETVAVDWEL